MSPTPPKCRQRRLAQCEADLHAAKLRESHEGPPKIPLLQKELPLYLQSYVGSLLGHSVEFQQKQLQKLKASAPPTARACTERARALSREACAHAYAWHDSDGIA